MSTEELIAAAEGLVKELQGRKGASTAAGWISRRRKPRSLRW